MGVGIVIKVRKQVLNHSPSILHVFTQVHICSWVGVHTCTNETHSLAPLQDLIPTLAASIQSRGAPICKITDILIIDILAKKITYSDIKYHYILIHQLISFHTWNILSL